jgi:copper(I)-binding protein
MKRSVFAAFAAALLIAGAVAGTPTAQAHDYKLGSMTIEHPWARASAGPVRNGAAYLVIRNDGAADRLLAVSGTVAERVELHTHLMEGDVMKMRRVEAVEVPANGKASLQPGSFHIMLVGLTEPLKEGERFPLTLTFEKAGSVTVEVAVEGVGSMGPQHGTLDNGTMNHGTMNHGTMDHGAMPPAN